MAVNVYVCAERNMYSLPANGVTTVEQQWMRNNRTSASEVTRAARRGSLCKVLVNLPCREFEHTST